MTNQLSLIPSTTPLLSIQDAAQAFTQKNGTGLVLGGCAKIVTHDDRMQPPPNCTTTCEDLSEVFSSAATFQNCLALPTISNLGRTGALSRDDLALMKTFGLDEGFGAVDVAASVVEPIVDCLVGYVSWCQSDSVCAEGDTKALSDACAPSRLAKSSNSSFLSDDTHSGIANCIDSLCATIVAPVNTDIAGVGVYVSYLMQAGLVLVAFLALKWWDSGLYYTCLVARLARQGYVEAQRRALRTEARHLQHKERLIVALVEFQKAQCFFMLAVQIAALVVLHDGLLAASNLEQIFIDTKSIEEPRGVGAD
ncbi:MAG: hypothetical protein M1838_002413 [Thelocarpon superellum]|nr:MAG: hypothetical protein M1838_002413 [Thelocarpon superellum]